MVPDDELFTSLTIPRVIDTDETDFVNDFYNPLLSRAVEYKRGVGYFTTNWLRSAARGIAALAANGGTAKLVTSPQLERSDWEALKRGNEAQEDQALYKALSDEVTSLQYNLEYQPRNAIAWMIADGLLEIQFAIPDRGLRGNFHDKFGVLQDMAGNKVAFHGSQNDSAQAFENYEAYTVDCSWLSDRDIEGIQLQEKRFDDIWHGRKPNLDTYTLPDGIRDDIASLRDRDYCPYETPEEGHDITLRDYQQKALESWSENGFRGLFKMATGTGKTFTAIGAMDHALTNETNPVLVVVAVPVTHLAQQWADELEAFNYENPKFIYGSANSQWKTDFSKITADLNAGVANYTVVLTTHTTLASEYFRQKGAGGKFNSFLIGDEVHRLGSDHQRGGLLDDYDYRIGLSATPERYYDEEGSEYILEYFDGVVFEYTLKEAIPEYLTAYDYEPIIVQMTTDELEEYSSLSRRLARAASSEDANEEVVELLATKRANILKSAENKYNSLQTVLSRIGEPDHLLVYTNPQQIDHVQDILNSRGVRQHKFTYREDDNEREQLLRDFDSGEYGALVAMRCLDEGVDVPSTRQAVLMSNSGNPMQFIQRRGRVLRKHPGKQKATIYDFIVVPSMNPDRHIIESERGILKRELRRFEEFAASARNENSARNSIERVRMIYELGQVDEVSEDSL